MLLEVESVTKRFGGLVAVDGVSLQVESGQVVAVVGPNGSGKSTLLNLLTGIYKADRGTVRLEGTPITRSAPSAIAKRGIARTFQNLQLFADLSIVENVLVGRHCRLTTNIVQALLGTPGVRREEARAKEDALELLTAVGLHVHHDRNPHDLSYGQRRLVEVARALASEPKLLILDEPMAGLSSGEGTALAALVRELTASGTAVILVEHNMRFVMALADRVAVLNFGKKIADGLPAEIRENPDVLEAYLGTDDADD